MSRLNEQSGDSTDLISSSIMKEYTKELGIPTRVDNIPTVENAISISPNNKLEYHDGTNYIELGIGTDSILKSTIAEARIKADGYNTVNTTDFEGNIWYYDPNDTTSLDDGYTVFVTTSNKRYKALYDLDVFSQNLKMI